MIKDINHENLSYDLWLAVTVVLFHLDVHVLDNNERLKFTSLIELINVYFMPGHTGNMHIFVMVLE